MQHERALKLDSPVSPLRMACLTGVVHRKMAGPLSLPPGNSLTLTAGNLDKAVAGLLTTRLVASDVNGQTAPAGFTRTTAFGRQSLAPTTNCVANASPTTLHRRDGQLVWPRPAHMQLRIRSYRAS
ncbi:hypothetical protein BST14_17845 [Mycobacterium arosiense ATCC BAA-1401 = DSM 45069]|uniref:Uncharacterized protein n=1 Tax=Mycobacterium arosiense ATCC BAA-1401 = DSM 45069 TaxID=1265311 RepID=A0A1W9ZCI9_MYCAI|nr:hypothetical protein BST14_17845 [Mycobacterium arosiense ATCC BAA-1401 = DSM 45069]